MDWLASRMLGRSTQNTRKLISDFIIKKYYY